MKTEKDCTFEESPSLFCGSAECSESMVEINKDSKKMLKTQHDEDGLRLVRLEKLVNGVQQDQDGGAS